MPTLQQVWAQIDALPHKYIFYTKKEIRYLPKVLGEDERILALTSGYMNNRTWLMVCTNKRVLLLDRGMFWGLRQVSVSLDRIQSIDSSFVIFLGSIRIWDGASVYEVSMILKQSIAPFVKTTQEAIEHYKRTFVQDMLHKANTPSQAPLHTPSDWLTELERLAALRQSGHISDEEFAAQKAKLLAK